MKLLITEAQLKSLVINETYYKPELKILTTTDNVYKVGYYHGKPLGAFNLKASPDMQELWSSFDIYDKSNNRNWHRCIGMLPIVYKHYMDKYGFRPNRIPIYGPRFKRYMSSEFGNYMKSYFANDYDFHMLHNGILLTKKKDDIAGRE